MSCYANSVPQVHFSCAQYMCLSFAPAATSKKPALSIRCHVSLGEKKTSYSTFRHNLLQHLCRSPTSSLTSLLLQISLEPGLLRYLHGFFFFILFFLFFSDVFFFFFSPPFPPAARGLISTSPWFSGTVSHLQQRTHRSQGLADS